MELEKRKNLLINQLDVFAKKHKFNKNDFLENYLKNEIEKFILYELNLPYSCVRVDLGIKFISQIDSMVIKMINHVVLIGRLTKDPELYYTNNKKAFTQFILAVNRIVSNDSDKTADFIRCQAWGKTAENLVKFMRKGSQIALTGTIRTSTYEKNGRTCYSTDIVANEIQFLDSIKKVDNVEQIFSPDNDYPLNEGEFPF